MIPDGAEIVGSYLRDHPDIEALQARVGAKTPNKLAKPWVRITQLDASWTHESDHLVRFMFQLDCYASETASQSHTAHAEASLLNRTVREALRVLPDNDAGLDATVSAVTIVSNPRMPDMDFKPALERYVLTAQIGMHS